MLLFTLRLATLSTVEVMSLGPCSWKDTTSVEYQYSSVWPLRASDVAVANASRSALPPREWYRTGDGKMREPWPRGAPEPLRGESYRLLSNAANVPPSRHSHVGVRGRGHKYFSASMCSWCQRSPAVVQPIPTRATQRYAADLERR